MPLTSMPPGLLVRLEDRHLVAVERKVMRGSRGLRARSRSWPRAASILPDLPAHRLVDGRDPRVSVTKRLSARMATGRVPVVSQAAPLLALVVANAGADRREGIGLANDPVRLLVFAARQMSHIAPGFRAQRAGGMARRPDQLLAHEGIATLVDDVVPVFFEEVAQRARAPDWRAVWPRPHIDVSFTTSASSAKQVEVLRVALPLVMSSRISYMRCVPLRQVKHLPHDSSFRKAHVILGEIHHAGVLIHHDHAAGAHDGSGLGQAVVIDRQVEHARRDAAAGRPAGLHRLDARLAPERPPPMSLTMSAMVVPIGDFDQAGILDLAHQAEDLGAVVVRRPDFGKLGGTRRR